MLNGFQFFSKTYAHFKHVLGYEFLFGYARIASWIDYYRGFTVLYHFSLVRGRLQHNVCDVDVQFSTFLGKRCAKN